MPHEKHGGALKRILTEGTVTMRHGMTQRKRTCWVLELECGHVSYITELPAPSRMARCPVCRPKGRPGTEQFHRVCSVCGQHRRIYTEGMCSQCKPAPEPVVLVRNTAELAPLDDLARTRKPQSYRQRHYWR